MDRPKAAAMDKRRRCESVKLAGVWGACYAMKVDVNSRHAEICGSHQVSLVCTHARNQDSVGNSVNGTIVPDCEVRDLARVWYANEQLSRLEATISSQATE